MKRPLTRKKKVLLASAGVVLTAGLAVFALAPRDSFREMTAIEGEAGKLLQWQNLDLNLDHATTNEAIAVLNHALAEHPETARFHVALWPGKALPRGFHLEEAIPGSPHPVVQNPASRGIDLHIDDVSLYQALMAVARASGRSAGRVDDTLYLVEGTGNFGMMTHWTMELAQSSFLTSAPAANDSAVVQQYLRDRGMHFYEGSEVRAIAGGRVRLRNLVREVPFASYWGVKMEPTWRERLAEWRARLPVASAQLWESIQTKMRSSSPTSPAPAGESILVEESEAEIPGLTEVLPAVQMPSEAPPPAEMPP